ncbi:MAG: glucosamine-6-phosphate deaminase [candidate division NC10 bacterium]|nr:glucosamine-6-phosphate deaminase [candidate division NC10 bacterium]
MKIAVFPSAAEMSRTAAESAAEILRTAIREKGRAAFVAATGASQFAFLEHLTAAQGIPWERITMFHLDEYIDMPASHPASFRRYLRERLTGKVPIGTVHFITGDAPDLAAEIRRLNAIIAATPVDAAFVGIGENGHLAFNDPPADFATEMPFIVVPLDEACRRQQMGEGWFKTLDHVPRLAVSMSIRQILKAAHIVGTVPDQRKAKAVQACLEGQISPLFPASVLRTHPRCHLFLDAASASLLKKETLTRE